MDSKTANLCNPVEELWKKERKEVEMKVTEWSEAWDCEIFAAFVDIAATWCVSSLCSYTSGHTEKEKVETKAKGEMRSKDYTERLIIEWGRITRGRKEYVSYESQD